MSRHVFSLLLIGLLAAFSEKSHALITINTNLSSGFTRITTPSTGTTTPGSSPAPASSPAAGTPVSPTIYFANIASTLVDTLTPPRYYGDGSTACSTTINPKCINSGASLNLSITSTVATGSGTMYLVYCTTGTPSGAIPGTSCTKVSQVSYTGNVAFTFPIPWATICGNATFLSSFTDMNSACGVSTPAAHTNHSVAMFLVADPTNAGQVTAELLSFTIVFAVSIPVNSLNQSVGFQDFLAFPGDERIHIKNPVIDGQFPASDNDSVGIQALRLYYAPSSSINYNASEFNNLLNGFPSSPPTSSDLGVNTDGTLTSTTVEGLTNGVRYYFRSAQVDNAGNAGYYEIDTDGSTHSAVPDQVVGLLAESGHCFVATAAYGSPLAGQVGVLREFRDKYLMRTPNGRNFVSWYYRHSPPVAAIISENEGLRTVVRGFLYPVVGYSWLALKWGPTNAALFIVTLFLLPVLFYRARKNYLKLERQK